MNDYDLLSLPAVHQREMILNREVSSQELTAASLRRVRDVDGHLHAFITVDEEGALQAASRADEALSDSEPPGALHGVPISVKDLESTAGIRTTFGSAFFTDWIPENDSAVVSRIKAAGGVMLGKTNTPEFGNRAETFNGIAPACNNPWDVSRMAGGSSGGAAVSLLMGMCALATGSDGGGSIRLPAAFCGVFGIKPTHGRVPRTGGRGAVSFNPFSTSGPMSNYVSDSAMLLQVMSGFDKRDPGSLYSSPPDYSAGIDDGVNGMRIGLSLTLGFAEVDDEVKTAVEKAAMLFESDGGARLEDANLSVDPQCGQHWWQIWTANQQAMYGHLYDRDAGAMMPYTMEMVEHGRTVTGADYSVSMRKIEEIRLQLDEFFERFDLLLLPTTAVTAWPHQQPPRPFLPDAVPFTIIFNLSHHPAASVPCGFDSNGLPIGLQIVSKRDADAMVLRASRAFEQIRPWTQHKPNIG